jgi:hypothetical protein
MDTWDVKAEQDKLRYRIDKEQGVRRPAQAPKRRGASTKRRRFNADGEDSDEDGEADDEDEHEEDGDPTELLGLRIEVECEDDNGLHWIFGRAAAYQASDRSFDFTCEEDGEVLRVRLTGWDSDRTHPFKARSPV